MLTHFPLSFFMSSMSGFGSFFMSSMSSFSPEIRMVSRR
jgi:hypothetical protein